MSSQVKGSTVEMNERLKRLIDSIDFRAIREESFNALKEDGLISGKNEDIPYLIMEQVDRFKVQHQKMIKSLAWDIIFQAIRKELSKDIKQWHNDKINNLQADEMAKQLVAAMTDDLENFDLGEAGA